MNKIFIIGTITEDLPNEFQNIEEKIKQKYNAISTYDSQLLNIEKINYVFKNIENSKLVIALLPTISFGTSFEIGYASSIKKNVLVILSNQSYKKIKSHPIIKLENITIKNINDDDILQTIQNLL